MVNYFCHSLNFYFDFSRIKELLPPASIGGLQSNSAVYSLAPADGASMAQLPGLFLILVAAGAVKLLLVKCTHKVCCRHKHGNKAGKGSRSALKKRRYVTVTDDEDDDAFNHGNSAGMPVDYTSAGGYGAVPYGYA